MKIVITEKEAKQHKSQYDEIIDHHTKKGNNISDIEWSYNYGVAIGMNGLIEEKTVEDAIENMCKTHGISLEGKVGKSNKYTLIDTKSGKDDLPQRFKDIAKERFDEEQDKIQKEQNFVANMDSVLSAVGKKGSAQDTRSQMHGVMNGEDFLKFMMGTANEKAPVYPTLDDIQQARKDIYDQYLSKADGTKLVMFNPRHGECDEWGFVIEEIYMVTKRLNGDNKGVPRAISRDLNGSSNYEIHRDVAYWSGSLRSIDKAVKAKEGTEFVGWNKSKQYKYTQEEIYGIIGDKIFHSDINIGGIQKQMPGLGVFQF